ncbi:unnamed protein product [Cuscuta campestris]|uniref:Peptidase A1 domain-containing protein n=1 Tax=Cuscuta campestris TaxID=132261 RepID=A0A484K6Q5_9ASTE|nr:unnamed protein product [Cuscuta campestris]
MGEEPWTSGARRRRDRKVPAWHKDYLLLEVTRVLGAAGLPAKGTAEYYSAWAAYDHRRHLSSSHRHSPAFTFAGGDVTENINNLARCGKVETGDFLDVDAVNGLLGLGYTALDVTSLLSSQGLVRNSFSMCFAPNGYGRIAFGDKGDDGLTFTPILPTFDKSPYYNIEIEHISVENVVINVSLVALFDSGTTLTYLTGEAYTLVTKIRRELNRAKFAEDIKIQGRRLKSED